MHNMSKTVALVLVALGALLGLWAWQMGSAAQAQPQPVAVQAAPGVVGEEVVVAKRAIAAGQTIQADDVGVARLPRRPAGAFVQTAQAVGQVLSLDLPAGTPVLDSFVWQGLALMLQDGERAVAVKVEESSAVGHQLRPGDWVDVFFYVRRDSQEVGQSQSRLLLARKRVLAYGPLLLEPVAAKGDKQAAAAGAAGARAVARTAVLAVGVADVNPLSLADRQGQLVLALRNPQDHGMPDPQLLAALPSVIAVPNQARPSLGAMDQAQLGLGLPALSAGPGGKPPARPAASAAARAGRSGEGGSGSTVAVEFIRGTQAGTVRY